MQQRYRRGRLRRGRVEFHGASVRRIFCLMLILAVAGCVPIGVRVQNMYAVAQDVASSASEET